MANPKAVTISSSLNYSANGVSARLSTTTVSDQTGVYVESGIQGVGTSEETLDKGDVGTIGKLAIRNMDITNFVQVGHTTGSYAFSLSPGEGVVIPKWNSNSVYVKADTAACNVEYLIIEV